MGGPGQGAVGGGRRERWEQREDQGRQEEEKRRQEEKRGEDSGEATGFLTDSSAPRGLRLNPVQHYLLYPLSVQPMTGNNYKFL